MPRPIQYDAEDVVRRATSVFWRNGYHRTGVRELLAATGCNRRGLYERFGGKDGLFAAAMDYYRSRHIDHIVALLEGPDAGLDALRELFHIRLRVDPARGCLVLNTLAEQAGIDDRLIGLAREQQSRIEAGVLHCLECARAAGDLDSRHDLGVLAKYVMTLLHGFGPVSRGGLSPDELQQIADQAIAHLGN